MYKLQTYIDISWIYLTSFIDACLTSLNGSTLGKLLNQPNYPLGSLNFYSPDAVWQYIIYKYNIHKLDVITHVQLDIGCVIYKYTI